VVIETPSDGEYNIEVTARSLVTDSGPQPFSLVVSAQCAQDSVHCWWAAGCSPWLDDECWGEHTDRTLVRAHARRSCSVLMVQIVQVQAKSWSGCQGEQTVVNGR